MRQGVLLLSVLLWAPSVWGHPPPVPTEVRDDGTNVTFTPALILDCQDNIACVLNGSVVEIDATAGGGAPTTAEYVVTEANGSLSAEVAPSAANQVPNSTSSTAGSWTSTPTLDTLDTGQGANELYDMDQNVLTTSTVTFDDITTSSATPCFVWTDSNGDDFEACVDGNQLLVSNVTNGSVYLILTSGSIFLPGFVSCNLDTDGFGKLTCGTDAGGGGNSFETVDVPAGTDPVADSATDTLTITETSFLTITGTAGTDTIDITQVTTDIGTDGLIALNAVALGTDTTNAYVATVADAGNSTITVAGSGAETAAVTLDAIDLNCTGCLSATELAAGSVGASEIIEAEDYTFQDVTSSNTTPTYVYDDTDGDNFETWADDNQWGLANTTDGVQAVHINAGNQVDFLRGHRRRHCATYENLVARDDNTLFPLATDESVTVKEVYCRTLSFTTLPTISFEDDSGNALTGAPTCGNEGDYIPVTAGGGLIRSEGIRFDVTNTPAPVTGTQTRLCVVYEEDG